MSTSGRIHVLLLVLALAAIVVGAIFLFIGEGRDDSAPRILASGPAPNAASSSEAIDAGGLSPAIGSEAPSASPEDVSTAVSGAASTPGGSLGVIRGEVLVRDGATIPQRWALHFEPHPWLSGSERAVSRRRDFERGETSFVETDLPLGGYLVRAEAIGLNCLPASVLLVPGSADQFVSLLLTPGGFIDGGVLDSEGRPAEGLEITLESTDTRQRSTLSTDAAGTFLFRDVLDGEYRLLFGRPDSPLLPPDSIAFKAPSLRFPTRTLPPTGSIRITVLDESLRPKARVQISGSAPRGSAIDTFSNHVGIAYARYLLPGRYRIDARSEEGLAASATVELAPGKEVPLEILVRDKRRD